MTVLWELREQVRHAQQALTLAIIFLCMAIVGAGLLLYMYTINVVMLDEANLELARDLIECNGTPSITIEE